MRASGIIKKAICLILAAAAALTLVSCKREPAKRTAVFYDYFDTVITLTAYTDDAARFEEAKAEAETVFSRLHRLFDIYNEYEGMVNLAAVNASAGESVHVDGDIIDLLRRGKEYCALTGGAVNIAMGAVLRLWHECRAGAEADPASARLPGEAELKSASEHCDINDLLIDEENGTVTLADLEMSVDVGAIAKGFAADRAARALSEFGFPFMLNCGGAVTAYGSKPDGGAWKAGVTDPMNTEGYAAVVPITEGSLSTSGSYLRYFTVGGREYGHIIDPDTLYPAETIASVTVFVPGEGGACLSDALSTACFILGTEKGMELIINCSGAEALFESTDGVISKTEGFPG